MTVTDGRYRTDDSMERMTVRKGLQYGTIDWMTLQNSDDVPLSVKALVGCKDCVGCELDVSRRQPVVQFMVSNKL